MKSRNNLIIIGFVVAPLAFVFTIVLLWSRDFFVFNGTDASAKIVGTALTLGGGLVATMVTLIGLILRQSVEERNADLREEAEKRLSLDTERNRALQEEAERRLKLEAAIRAVALLGTDSGGDTNLMQRTGALFSLARLGLIDLSIDLVRPMFTDGLIGPNATSSLLDIALRSNDPTAQKKAGEFLRDHSDLLVSKEGFEWPDCISLDWPQELNFYARNDALQGLMTGILALPMIEWEEPRLYACVAYLAVAFIKEQDPRLKANIALFLHEFLNIFSTETCFYLLNENIGIDTLRQQVTNTDITSANNSTRRLTKSLSIWINDGKSGKTATAPGGVTA